MQVVAKDTLNKISEKIDKIEKSSSCELLMMMTKESDDYRYITISWAAVGALVLPVPLLYFSPALPTDTLSILSLQWGAFLSALLLGRIDAVRFRLVPKSIRLRRAALKARESFISLGLNSESSPPAILFFISLKEQYVEIITNAKVPIPNESWRRIVDTMVARIKSESLDSGILEALDALSDVMRKHCPSTGEEGKNRYPNKLIILD